MSTLEPYTEGILISPELRIRISEIMEEKGKAFSQNAIAIRIGMHYETLRKKLRGENKIQLFELRRIAEALHLTVERLMKTDTQELEQELKSIFDALMDASKIKEIAHKIKWTESMQKEFSNGNYSVLLKQRALDIALQLSSVAVGVTERSMTLNDLGRAYFHLRSYKDAHETWLKAYGHAKKLADKKKENKEPLFKIISNLAISYSNMNEYSGLTSILKEVDHIIENDHIRTGIIYYSLAKVAERIGDLDNAKEYYYKSLNAYYHTQHPNSIGIALHNTARFEYRIGNFASAKELFEKAIPILTQHHLFQELSCIKEYCKTLAKIGDSKKAEQLLTNSINITFPNEILYVKAQLLILLSIIKSDPEHATAVLELEVDKKYKNIACKFLMNYYNQQGDSQSVMKYYRVSATLTDYDIFNEEDL